MHTSLVGVICIIMGAFSIFNYNFMPVFAIICAPLVTCAVIQTESFYLQPGHFILMFWVIAYLFKTILYNQKITLYKYDGWLMLFIIFTVLSIIFSSLIEYNALVYGIGNGLQLRSSNVTFQNITQLLYLITGLFLYFLLVDYVEKVDNGNKLVIKAIIFSGFIVNSIGLYQIFANFFDLPFQSIFRNDARGMWQTMNRVQATMNEASIYGQFCSLILPVYIWDSNLNKNKMYRILLIALNIATGIVSRSTTYLMALVVIVGISWFFYTKAGKNFFRGILLLCAIIITALSLYAFNESMQLLIDVAIKKFQFDNGSAIERTTIAIDMLHTGFSYPILGVGYGSGRSTDLYTSLFATIGILGTIPFFIFLFCLMRKSIQKIKLPEGKIAFLIICALLVSFLTCPDLNVLFVWVFIAAIKFLVSNSTQPSHLILE